MKGKSISAMAKTGMAAFLCCVALSCPPAQAQDQEIQQLLLNVQKLEQLKDMLLEMKRKYEIVQQGYLRVKSVTEGNFRLHEVFLGRLLKVSPQVRQYYRVAEAIQLQLRIVSQTRSLAKALSSEPELDWKDLEYLAGVFAQFNRRSIDNIAELMLVLSDDRLQMDDMERISAIDRIHGDMGAVYRSLQAVAVEMDGLVRMRSQASASLETLGNLFHHD